MLSSSYIFSVRGSSRGGFVRIHGCNIRHLEDCEVRSAGVCQTPCLSLWTGAQQRARCNRIYKIQFQRQQTLLRTLGEESCCWFCCQPWMQPYTGDTSSHGVWGQRLCSSSLVMPSYRGSVPCLLWEMSWCAGWALAQISSFFSLYFFAVCRLQLPAMGDHALGWTFYALLGSTFLVGCSLPQHCGWSDCCRFFTPSLRWWNTFWLLVANQDCPAVSLVEEKTIEMDFSKPSVAHRTL